MIKRWRERERLRERKRGREEIKRSNREQEYKTVNTKNASRKFEKKIRKRHELRRDKPLTWIIRAYLPKGERYKVIRGS